MNSKFAPIVKIKEQILSQIQVKLSALKKREKELEESFDIAQKSLVGFKFPKNGNFTVMKNAIYEQNLLRQNKNAIYEELSLTKKQITHHKHQYKLAYIELEKIKFLHSQEVKGYMQKIKKTQEAIIDDIAAKRYFFQER